MRRLMGRLRHRNQTGTHGLFYEFHRSVETSLNRPPNISHCILKKTKDVLPRCFSPSSVRSPLRAVTAIKFWQLQIPPRPRHPHTNEGRWRGAE